MLTKALFGWAGSVIARLVAAEVLDELFLLFAREVVARTDTKVGPKVLEVIEEALDQ